ncbi:MAG TPA: hypothetical protein VFA98_01915 [Thermoanaerobaculia bacterium]|jgi:hypothetical protein|nr:hypothetical protein [Thermoanaerobaculia bacterium]
MPIDEDIATVQRACMIHASFGEAFERLMKERDAIYDNLRSVQDRCTELLGENRKLRAGIVLAGWSCASCKAFNGEEKAPRLECRCCGKVRA